MNGSDGSLTGKGRPVSSHPMLIAAASPSMNEYDEPPAEYGIRVTYLPLRAKSYAWSGTYWGHIPAQWSEANFRTSALQEIPKSPPPDLKRKPLHCKWPLCTEKAGGYGRLPRVRSGFVGSYLPSLGHGWGRRFSRGRRLWKEVLIPDVRVSPKRHCVLLPIRVRGRRRQRVRGQRTWARTPLLARAHTPE
jgi:hypothetical protein